jgi:hypothetical protein
MEQVSSFEHRGTPMVLIDFSGSGPKDVLALIDQATPLIRKRAPKSVATISNVAGASFDSDVIAALKDFAKGNEPHVRTAAIVGLTGMQRIVLSAVSYFTGRTFLLCESVEEAKSRLSAPA